MKTAAPASKLSLKKTIITRFSTPQAGSKQDKMISSSTLDTWTSVL